VRRAPAWLAALAGQASCLVGGAIVVLVIGAAILAPLIAPHDPVAIDIENSLLPPGGDYLLGTDQGGRDLLSRIIWGARVSLMVSLLAVVIGMVFGVLLGLLAAHRRGGWVQHVIMRGMDMVASIPLLIWAIALVGIIGVQPVQVGPFTLGNEHKLLVLIGLLLSSAFSAIIVYAQELVPHRAGMIAGLFFGLAFGVSAVGAAGLGEIADHTGIEFIYKLCSILPAIGLLTVLLPNIERKKA